MATTSSKYLNPALRELWQYHPDTGKFTSKVRTNGRQGIIYVGDEVGGDKEGYVVLNHDRKPYRAHVLAWVWMKGTLPPKGWEIDHENTIKSDNRWTNLRLVTRGANNLNHGGNLRSHNTSGVVGVYRRWIVVDGQRVGHKWFAKIEVEEKQIYLGTFDTVEEAAEARKKAEAIYWQMQAEDTF